MEFRIATNETLPNFDEFIEQIKLLKTNDKVFINFFNIEKCLQNFFIDFYYVKFENICC